MAGFEGDVHLHANGNRFVIEAKARRSGFKFLYDALGKNNFLCVKRDRDKPLIIMDLNAFIGLIKGSFQQDTNNAA
jgi:hypothetical protein